MKTSRMYYDQMFKDYKQYGSELEGLRQIFSPADMVEFAANYHEYCMRVIRQTQSSKEIKNDLLGAVSDTVCVYCKERTAIEPLWICKECLIAYNKEKQTGR